MVGSQRRWIRVLRTHRPRGQRRCARLAHVRNGGNARWGRFPSVQLLFLRPFGLNGPFGVNGRLDSPNA